MNTIYRERFYTLIRAVKEGIRREDAACFKNQSFTMAKYGHMCGSPACALGHYAYRTDLQDTFFLKPRKVEEGEDPATASAFLMTKSETVSLPTTYNSIKIQEHFGLTYHEAERLFSSYGCDNAKTREEVVAYLQGFALAKYPAT